LLGLGHFLSFWILYTVSKTPYTGDQPVARPLVTQDNTNTAYTHTDTHALSGALLSYLFTIVLSLSAIWSA
jgi:hypothetical protein